MRDKRSLGRNVRFARSLENIEIREFCKSRAKREKFTALAIYLI